MAFSECPFFSQMPNQRYNRTMALDKPRRRRYEAQDRESNCGPVAVYNAMIWSGKKPRIYRLESVMQCHDDYGTSWAGLDRGLVWSKIPFSVKRAAKLKDIEEALDAGHAVIYLYAYNRTLGHYIFIDGHTKTQFRVVNDIFPGVGNAVRRLRSKSYFAKKRSKRRKYPTAWIVRRRKQK